MLYILYFILYLLLTFVALIIFTYKTQVCMLTVERKTMIRKIHENVFNTSEISLLYEPRLLNNYDVFKENITYFEECFYWDDKIL